MRLTQQVRAYWEGTPCGTNPEVVGEVDALSPEWFERVEDHRYAVEPFIHAIAQFTRHRGKRVLEVGVGAGTDHLQWARAGAECHGVDLTDAAIEITRARLAHYGLSSRLQRANAEEIPYGDDNFDTVYSWGVIHHTERPEMVVAEIRRVLKPTGQFIGMFYSRRSIVALRFWLRHALFAGRPWRSLADVIWHHMESVGTRCYTAAELKAMFGGFASVHTIPLLTTYDTVYLPLWLARLLPNSLGWFIVVRATK
jgi:ubiquinone/menaquinone biosynthesis C-methylase UbiE